MLWAGQFFIQIWIAFTEARHGIVLTVNYIAKRAGVKTGMALWQARQVCPEIIFVPLLSSKLNVASSVTLKQVFYSAWQRYQSHSFGRFRHTVLCKKPSCRLFYMMVSKVIRARSHWLPAWRHRRLWYLNLSCFQPTDFLYQFFRDMQVSRHAATPACQFLIIFFI